MASELDEQKKILLPILQRATEIAAMEPRVAYYCRLYALKRALELPHPAPPIKDLMKALFDQCEKDKPKIQPNEAADREYCKNFALTVFNRADKMDRANRADINTAKCYYAAAIFLQVLEQFLNKDEQLELLEPEAVEKARYALWRAAELRKAMREGRPPAPPPEPADVAAAVAGTSAQALHGSSGGGAGADLFAGPAYEAGIGSDEHQQQQQQPPPVLMTFPAGPVGGAVSSTEEFLNLPHPPSTIPPEGSVGLVEPAAAVGPRFRPGSAVWVASAAAADDDDDGGHQPPIKGTVGQLLSPNAGVGGQAVYKVALPHAIQELPDSQLAPALEPGARVLFVPGVGEHPQPASVIATQTDAWPCRYLLQMDDGGNLAAAGGQIRLHADGLPHQGLPAAAAQPGAGPYPSLQGTDFGGNLPAAPPLVDAAAPQQPSRLQPQVPLAAPPPQPPHPYNGAPVGGPSQRGGSVGQTPVAQHPASGTSPSAAAALEAAIQAAKQGTYQPSAAAVSEAQKYAKFAVSSLNHDDVAGAVKFLSDALRTLLQPK